MVTGTADEVVETGALAAKDEDTVAGEVELVVVLGAALVEADDPDVVLLQVFEGADEIDDTGDAEVLGGPGAGFDGHGTEGGGAALGEDDAIDAGAVGHAEERAEVLGIFDAIEGEEQTGGGGLAGRPRERGEEIFNAESLLRVHEGDNALVHGSPSDLGKLLTGLLADADAGLTALGNEAGEAVIVALAGDEHMVKAALAGTKCFFHRMQAVENFHRNSVEDGRVWASIARFGLEAAYFGLLKPRAQVKSFDAVLEAAGKPLYWVIARVPFDLKKEWPGWKTRRVRGEINGFEFRTSLFPTAEGK